MWGCLLCCYHLLAPAPSPSTLLTLLSAWPHWPVCTTWVASFCPGSWSGWDNLGDRVSAQQKTGSREDSEAEMGMPLTAFSQVCSDRLHPWAEISALLDDPPHLTVCLQISVTLSSLAPSDTGVVRAPQSGISLLILHCLPWFLCTLPTSL